MEIVTKINWVDVLVIIIILRTSYVAFQEGLSHEIFPLLSAIFTVSIALHYYNRIAFYIYQNSIQVPVALLDLIIFISLIVLLGFIFKFTKVILDKIIKVTWHPLIERLGGLIVGALRASITASIVLIIISMMPLPYLSWSVRERSLTGMYFLRIGPDIYERVAAFLPTVKVGEALVNKEGLVKKLVSDKPIEPAAKKDSHTVR
ncbi:MAG: CvpA family protein [Candidatus Omnitrophota bacterium]|nr:CvpA family protein [Candidatus Omnitrophota bacterium]